MRAIYADAARFRLAIVGVLLAEQRSVIWLIDREAPHDPMAHRVGVVRDAGDRVGEVGLLGERLVPDLRERAARARDLDLGARGREEVAGLDLLGRHVD